MHSIFCVCMKICCQVLFHTIVAFSRLALSGVWKVKNSSGEYNRRSCVLWCPPCHAAMWPVDVGHLQDNFYPPSGLSNCKPRVLNMKTHIGRIISHFTLGSCEVFNTNFTWQLCHTQYTVCYSMLLICHYGSFIWTCGHVDCLVIHRQRDYRSRYLDDGYVINIFEKVKSSQYSRLEAKCFREL